MKIEIVPVMTEDKASLVLAKELIIEYANSLDFDLDFQNFDHEVANLPGEYSEPEGRLYTALLDNKPAGCVALRKIDRDICEMKRLYVRPEFRGKGIGKALAEKVIADARVIDYRRMRLDTVLSMTEAIALYKSLGFVEIEKYRLNPLPHAVFLELDLTSG